MDSSLSRSLLLLFLLLTPLAAAPVLTVGDITANGADFLVPIEIHGAIELVNWQFDLAFDPAEVQVVSVSEGPFTSNNGQLLTLFLSGFADNFSGLVSQVSGSFLDFPPGPSGDGVLALVEFTSSNPTPQFQLQNVAIFPDQPANPAPEPATFVLLAGGLVAFRFTRRRI